MEEGPQRALFAGLAGVAALALVGAAVAWLLAVNNAGVWIIACLVVLVIVLAVEIALLVASRRNEPPRYHEPDPHKGPGSDDEVIDFIIEPDDAETATGAPR